MAEPSAEGVLVVDKAGGRTSHQVVGRARRLYGTRKVGHAGTLDPMATGVLLLGIGRATRLLGFLMATTKTYRATIRLGLGTDTDDAEGRVTSAAGAAGLEVAALAAAVQNYRGDILQVPTQVSAIKIDGVRSYARARRGEQVELAARPVRIDEYVLGELTRTVVDGVEVCDVDATVRCSSGTYIRALARDLGADLGTGGHLTALRRTRVGDFDLAEAVSLAEADPRTRSSRTTAATPADRPGHRRPPSPAQPHRERGRRPRHRLRPRPARTDPARTRPCPIRASTPPPPPCSTPRAGCSPSTARTPTAPGRSRSACSSPGRRSVIDSPLVDGSAAPAARVVVIGNFDGVHRGHQALIAAARATEPGAELVAVTFWPHPMSLIRPDHAPLLLCSLAERRRLLAAAGVDRVEVVDFTAEVAQWSPAEFVAEVIDPLTPSRVVVGENFRFGFRAAGDVATLTELGRGRFAVTGLTLLDAEAAPDSSTRVREAIAAGDLGTAVALLGHEFRYTGEVVHGEQRGREMGFPTANILIESDRATPPDGIYAGWVTRLDRSDGESGAERWPAAISVGDNPTFDGRFRVVESYVLDRTDLELYGVEIAVDFVARLRGQIRYTGMAALIEQMHLDVDHARAILS